MDEQVRALVSALDAIGYTRQQNPRVLKQMARDALNGFMSAQHSVQSDGAFPSGLEEHWEVGDDGKIKLTKFTPRR